MSQNAPIKPQADGVLFDLDGLMFNTEAVFHRTGVEMLRRRGKPAPAEVFRGMVGRRAADAWPVMIRMMDLTDTVEELEAEAHAVFPIFLEEHLAPMPGLFELLDALAFASIPLAVATSSGRSYALDLLQRFDLTDRFSTVLGAEDVSHGKPHPEIYRTAAGRIDVAPDRSIVLEDSEAGIASAKAAGATAVAVPHDYSHGQTYEEADLIIDTLADPRLYQLIGLRVPNA